MGLAHQVVGIRGVEEGGKEEEGQDGQRADVRPSHGWWWWSEEQKKADLEEDVRMQRLLAARSEAAKKMLEESGRCVCIQVELTYVQCSGCGGGPGNAAASVGQGHIRGRCYCGRGP